MTEIRKILLTHATAFKGHMPYNTWYDGSSNLSRPPQIRRLRLHPVTHSPKPLSPKNHNVYISVLIKHHTSMCVCCLPVNYNPMEPFLPVHLIKLKATCKRLKL